MLNDKTLDWELHWSLCSEKVLFQFILHKKNSYLIFQNYSPRTEQIGVAVINFFFNLRSGGWNQGPLDTAAT
jgi:hypothetical protein